MITRILLAIALLGTSAFAAEQAPKSDVCFTAPENWQRTIDAKQHLLSLIPGTGSALTFAESADFAGTAEEFQGQLWDGLQHALKIKTPATSGHWGEFQTISATFEKPDGSDVWIRVYSTVKNGRCESVMFLSTSEAKFRANLTAVDRLVGGITFATPESVASSRPAEPAVDSPAATTPTETSAAALPSELNMAVPSGWTAQRDPASHSVMMKPPNAPTANDAALVVFPAVAFAGTAEQYHRQVFGGAVGKSRLLEPVRQGRVGGFQMSGVHCTTAEGTEIWMAVYSARWGTRAQAVLWATDRADLFASNAKTVVALLKQVAVPGGPNPPEAAAANPDPTVNAPAANAFFTPPGSATSNSGGGADTGDTMPVLEYRDPPNFFRGGGKSYAEYNGSNINFTLGIYPFREFRGNIRQLFQQSMLRDWIDVMYREEGVAGQPRVVTNSIPGADTVIDAHFNDGRSQEHHRLVIVSGHWAAIVDMIAPTAFAYQKGFPSVLEMLKTMHVGRKPAPPSLANGPGPAGARLAGLFQGFKGKFTVNLMLGPGYGSPKTALHYYLFSADGRVYRCYDFPPGGSEGAARNFNFDSAERQDPQNSGRYAVRGNELYIKFGGPNLDEITATLGDFNALQLEGVTYQRKF